MQMLNVDIGMTVIWCEQELGRNDLSIDLKVKVFEFRKKKSQILSFIWFLSVRTIKHIVYLSISLSK